MRNYTALIIDIIKSKTYSRNDRSDIQVYINDVIQFLNSVFQKSCELKMVFSAGDEIQGLFKNIDAAYLYYRLCKMLISPVEIRGGIGVGEWTVQVAGQSSTAQDGPAYHQARLALSKTDPSQGYQLLVITNYLNDMIINSLISGETALVNSQSHNQKELLFLTEILHPIDANAKIDVSELASIIDLIKKKYELPYFGRIYEKRKDSLMMTAGAHLSDYQPNVQNVLINEPLSNITSGRIRGLVKQLSLLTETSQQNISNTLTSGNISQIRNLAAAALNMMHDTREGN